MYMCRQKATSKKHCLLVTKCELLKPGTLCIHRLCVRFLSSFRCCGSGFNVIPGSVSESGFAIRILSSKPWNRIRIHLKCWIHSSGSFPKIIKKRKATQTLVWSKSPGFTFQPTSPAAVPARSQLDSCPLHAMLYTSPVPDTQLSINQPSTFMTFSIRGKIADYSTEQYKMFNKNTKSKDFTKQGSQYLFLQMLDADPHRMSSHLELCYVYHKCVNM